MVDQNCIKSLEDGGFTPTCDKLGAPDHCIEVYESKMYHRWCHNAHIYDPVQFVFCLNKLTGEMKWWDTDTFTNCKELNKKDPNWDSYQCYCCCSCFANDTPIAVPDGIKPIYTIAKGEDVMNGSVRSSLGKLQISWGEAKVTFSEGTGPGGHQFAMVFLVYGETDDEGLVCSPDQVFLLADGTYTTAERLVPGQSLVDKDGKPVLLKLVSIGEYEGGLHHIATSNSWTGSTDGHLILAGGVVAGDYTLQLHFEDLPDAFKPKGYASLPRVGTLEYGQKHADLVKQAKTHFIFAEASANQPQVPGKVMRGKFQVYRVATGESLPYSAQAMLTPKQANAVRDNGTQLPPSAQTKNALFSKITKQLAGFYPDIEFGYDVADINPNVYAYDYYGKKFVVVTGGLVRLLGFNYEGLMMAMAHGIGCFYGGEPKNHFGYSTVLGADWYAFGVISREIWIGSPWLNYVKAALEQWDNLFGMALSNHAQRNGADPMNDPSLKCRMEVIESAAAGGSLPECAGGKPKRKLMLEEAKATSLSEVKLTFNLGVDPASAEDVSHYVLDPDAKIVKASLSKSKNFIVYLDLETDLEPGKRYTVTVEDLTSYIGTELAPEHASATFEVQSP